MLLPVCAEQRKHLQGLGPWLRPRAWTKAQERKADRQKEQMEVSAGVWPHCPEHHLAPSFSHFFRDGGKKAISGGHREEQSTQSKD